MTDPDLLAKKLALIETSVRELRTLARPENVARDERLGEPRTNRDRASWRTGWVAWPASGTSWSTVNQDVDLAIVRDILVNRLDDLLGFVRAIRIRLAP